MIDTSNKKFWKNKKVFITGHTGFKGSWLCLFLNLLGANIIGYSLKPERKSLYNLACIKKILKKSYLNDIRDYSKLKSDVLTVVRFCSVLMSTTFSGCVRV